MKSTLAEIKALTQGHDSLVGSLTHDKTDSTFGLADSYKPFTFDNEVSNCPAAQEWVVCTP